MNNSVKNHWLLSSLLLGASCQLQSKQQEQKIVFQKPVEQTEQVKDTTRIVNDYIVKILKCKTPYLKRKFYNSKFETTPSEYEPSVVDTLLTLYNQGNEFTYYTSGDKSAVGSAGLLRFRITSDTVILPDNIHINMSRNEVATKLGIKPFEGELLLTEEEGYQKLYFIFDKDKLTIIYFISTYIG